MPNKSFGHAKLLADLHALPAFLRRQEQRRQSKRPILFIGKPAPLRKAAPPVIPRHTAKAKPAALSVEDLKARLGELLERAAGMYQAGKMSSHDLVKFENRINHSLENLATTGKLS